MRLNDEKKQKRSEYLKRYRFYTKEFNKRDKKEMRQYRADKPRTKPNLSTRFILIIIIIIFSKSNNMFSAL